MESAAEPRRLLIVRPSLAGGGADRVTLTLLAHLDRRLFGPGLAIVRREGSLLPELPAEVPLHPLGARSLVAARRPLARLLRALEPDILFSTSSGGNVLAALAARRAGFRGRLVLSERNGLVRDQPYLKRIAMLRLKRWLYPRADAIAAVSEGVRQDLLARLRLQPERVHTTYNPVVGPELEAAASEPLAHPWAEADGARLLAAGRLEPAKDFATLLAALARVRERHPARLAILGEGSQRGTLTALAARLGCADAVALPGFDPNPYRWMRRCTLFVLSSRFEGLPGVLIQAMACGAPVVAADCPFGPGEIVEHRRTGMLVAVGDSEGLARAIAELLDDPAARSAMAGRGREASERFRVESILPRYERVLLGEP
jgi:glycosyltransferase involved in cell wall biosynthesis